MMTKAVFLKYAVRVFWFVWLFMLMVEMVIVQFAERGEYWAYVGIRLLFLVLLMWAFRTKKFRWLAWGAGCGLRVWCAVC